MAGQERCNGPEFHREVGNAATSAWTLGECSQVRHGELSVMCQENGSENVFPCPSDRLEGEWGAVETGGQSADSRVWLWALDPALIIETHIRPQR